VEPTDAIIRPIVTEKSTEMMAENKYVFEVAPDANKIEIRKAIEKLFNVKVVEVNTMRIRGKLRRMGRFEGRRPDRKKAVVTLAPGNRIEIFEGL